MEKGCAIALCRVSTLEQAHTGHSLERQRTSVKAAAERLGVKIVHVWSIDQSSRVGKNQKRRDLKEMLEYCQKEKQVKYLIVDELSRFMRDLEYAMYYKVRFQQLGVKIHVASQPELNDESITAKLLTAVSVFAAEAENADKSDRARRGQEARVRLGYYPFPVPQGYRKTITPGLFEPDPNRFTLLQTGLRLFKDGSSMAEVVKWLSLQGYTTPQGKKLYINRFRRMLRCAYYAGVIKIKRWDFVQEKCLHEPMISIAEFEQIQAMLDGKKYKSPRKNHNPAFPLANLVVCEECEGRLTGLNHSNGKAWSAPRYRCRSCNKLYKLEDVHRTVDGVLDSMVWGLGEPEKLKKILKSVWARNQEDRAQALTQLAVREGELAARKKGYLDAALANPEQKQSYLQYAAEVDADFTKLNIERVRLSELESDLVEFTDFALDFVQNLKDGWWKLEFEEKKKCKQLLFLGEITGKKQANVYTPEISPLFRFKGYEKEPFGGSDFDMVEVAGVTPASSAPSSAVLHAQMCAVRSRNATHHGCGTAHR